MYSLTIQCSNIIIWGYILCISFSNSSVKEFLKLLLSNRKNESWKYQTVVKIEIAHLFWLTWHTAHIQRIDKQFENWNAFLISHKYFPGLEFVNSIPRITVFNNGKDSAYLLSVGPSVLLIAILLNEYMNEWMNE